ncbi:hypothetical protein DWV90_20505, partial [Ruminococcus sp. AF13-37]
FAVSCHRTAGTRAPDYSKFREVKVRMLPERHEMVKKHATDHGESTSAFINRAIDEQIKRDSQ